MRVAIDLQGLQSEGSRIRGIGRYSFEIIRNIIEYGNENDYILFANGSLKDLRNEFKDQLQRTNVVYFEWFAPCPLDFYTNNYIRRKIGIYLRSYSLARLHVDLILITSFFEGFLDNCLIDIDREICESKQVSIFYDLIPLLKPKEYLDPNPKFAKFYRNQINKLIKLDGLLAISNHSAQELINNLDFPPNKILNISSACDQKIFNKDFDIKDQNLSGFSINAPFLLYTGAHDSRKNVKRLIQAYSEIDIKLRKKYKLVLAGKILEPESNLLDNWINDFNIDKSQIIKTGFISDKDLALLYRNCSLFIFPSLHEGFGLPVLEAMSCSAPVIGSNCTSVREVLCNEEVMFDPYNVSSIVDLIERALVDNKFKNLLLRNAEIQYKKFSWKKTACKAIQFFELINNKNINGSSRTNSNWLNFSNKNDILLERLITKIVSLDNRISNLDEISACIDNINQQSESICRSINKFDKICTWQLEGPLDSSYSLAILNRCFAEKLNSYVQKLSLKITEGPGDYEPDMKFLKQYKNIYNIYTNSTTDLPIYDVVSRNLYPPRVTEMNGTYNILHSYGWEESEFPKDWVDSFNDSLQGITVMSSLVKKILIDNGVNIPIKVTGLGVDHIENINSDSGYKIKAKKFKLLHISSCFPRKGFDILISAYERIFTIKDDVSLIIKTFHNPHNNIEDLLFQAKQSNPLFPEVVLIYDDLNDEQVRALYQQVDVLVMPSRGEGFGLPIGEAMRLGLPVITTAWGGQMDYCNQENCWLVDYKFCSSTSHFNSPDSYWAEPSIEDLINQIVSIYNSNSIDLKQKTDCAKKQIQSITWENTVKQNINFIENELGHCDQYFKLGCISPIYSKCGIASYTKYLLTNIEEEVSFFTPFKENEYTDRFHNLNIIPSWTLGKNNEDLTYLKNKVLSEEITSLVIQFNYGFFDFNHFADLIDSLKDNSINIFIILHSTLDPKTEESRSLRTLVESLKKADRLLVHTINDLNRLRILGLTKNVTLFPHGFLEFTPKSKNIFSSFNVMFRKKIFNIASYGFCLPNKGYRELILACNTLIHHGINLKLSIFSAIYSEEYYWVYEELIDLISKLNLQDCIHIETNYMKDEQTLYALSRQDCIVLPYQNTGESSSASVRHALASNKNILVTPSPIFDDVSTLVKYLPGFSYKEIASGLQKWFLESQKNQDKVDDIDLNREKIISERRFTKLSHRLISMIKSLELN